MILPANRCLSSLHSHFNGSGPGIHRKKRRQGRQARSTMPSNDTRMQARLGAKVEKVVSKMTLIVDKLRDSHTQSLFCVTRMALAMSGVTDRHLHRQCQRRTVCARSSKRRRHRRARVPVVHGGGGKRQRRARRMVMTCASARVTRNARDARDARCNRPLSHPPSPTPHLVRAIERRASAAAAATRACPGGTEIGDDARDAR